MKVNLFILDEYPKQVAACYIDRHVKSYIVDYAKILSACHHLNNPFQFKSSNKRIYRLCFKNHPITNWARINTSHYEWLFDLWVALCNEHAFRFSKIHKTEGLKYDLRVKPHLVRSNKITFNQFLPDVFKVKGDAIQAYRNYYVEHFHNNGVWTNRGQPDWWITHLHNVSLL